MYITFSKLIFILSLITSGFLFYQGLKFQKLNKKLCSLNQQFEEKIACGQSSYAFMVDILQVQVGKAIIKLVDPLQEDLLLPKIKQLRQMLYVQLGYVLPDIRIIDNPDLLENEYRFLIRGRFVAKGFIYLDKILIRVSDIKDKNGSNYSKEINEESFILSEPMCWIDKGVANKHKINGLAPTDVLISHFKICIGQNLDDIITLEYIAQMLESIKVKHPVCVNTLVPKLIDIVDLKIILINLLKDNISIKNIYLILEKLCDYARLDKNLESLTKKIKEQLREPDIV